MAIVPSKDEQEVFNCLWAPAQVAFGGGGALAPVEVLVEGGVAFPQLYNSRREGSRERGQRFSRPSRVKVLPQTG